MTSLYGGKRISKSDPQVGAYGTVDELTSFIGLTSSKLKNKKERKFLISTQKDLYEIMAYMSGAKVSLDFLNDRVLVFENKIDELDKSLPRLKKFIIPGGTELSSWFHVLRAVCRRCERKTIQQFNNLTLIKYLNRLSDLFFTLARFYNRGREVTVWPLRFQKLR